MSCPETHPYFAYGSNMCVDQMAERCPNAQLIGVVTLDGWELFMDQAGYATIERRTGASVEGVLWEIGPADERSLDDYEGISTGYYEKRVVRVAGPAFEGEALVYVSLRGPACMETFRERYMADIRHAAAGLGLSAAAQERLASVKITG